MSKGKYIVIEGIEGVGKSNILQMIAYQLRKAGLPVAILHDPNIQNNQVVHTIDQLGDNPNIPISGRTKILLDNAARSQTLESIQKAITKGVICLVDTSFLTSLVIQYYGQDDPIDYDEINAIIEFSTNGKDPDLMIVLDTPINILQQRIKDYPEEKIPSSSEARLERIRAGYLWEAKQRGLPIVYANNDIDVVFKQVWDYITDILDVKPNDKIQSDPQSLAEVLAARNSVFNNSISPTQVKTVKNNLPQPTEESSLEHVLSAQTPEFVTPKRLGKGLTNSYNKIINNILATRAKLLVQLKGFDAQTVAGLTLPAACFPAGLKIFQSEANNPALATLIKSRLKETYNNGETNPISLVNYWPRNELDVVPEIVYGYSSSTLDQLDGLVSNWPYEQKSAALSAYAGGTAGLGKIDVFYTWDILSEYLTFLQLQDIGLKPNRQELSPRYGFDVPAAIEQANLSDLYESCFDASLDLYSKLQASGRNKEAQNAVLLGHKLRFKLTLSAKQLLDISVHNNSALSQLSKNLLESVSEVHPILGQEISAKAAK
ncbi:MAG: hypothetical protein ABI220_02755 [Candidatus Saccharimonadales bacterium]